MRRIRPYLAGAFLLISALLIVPQGYWHDCTHGRTTSWDHPADAELVSADTDCLLCDYMQPVLSLVSFELQLAQRFVSVPRTPYRQLAGTNALNTLPSLRGPPQM